MRRAFCSLFCLLLCACVLSSCASPQRDEKSFYAMGSFVAVTVYGGSVPTGISATVTDLEGEISYKLKTSSISRANEGETVLLSESIRDALSLCGELTQKTQGAFDLTIKPVSQLWGFDLAPASPPNDAALQDALARVGWQEGVLLTDGALTLDNAELDLGAIGKGLACDYLIDNLRQNGLCGIVSVGGSIGVLTGESKESYRVGIRDPFSENRNQLLGTLILEDGFVSTSGTYEKRFEHGGKEYHHILNANTGLPEYNGVVSVTVVAERGVLSDALSTAAFLVGAENGMRLCKEYGAEAIFVLEDGTVIASEGLRDRFLYEGGAEVVYR